MLKNYYKEDELEVGIDESGAGPMMGNLYIAAVILPPKCPVEKYNEYWEMLNDSKKLSAKKRELLFDFIQEIAIDYSIIDMTPEEIDHYNILNARKIGFHRAIDALNVTPTHIIVDGNVFDSYENIPHICIEGGDAKYKSIAAASILAKVSRDRDIIKLHDEYPEYNWIKNKGYGTQEHRNAIKKYGITKYHRKSFGICRLWEDLPKKFYKK